MNEKSLMQLFEKSSMEQLQKSSEDYFRLMAYYRCAMMEVETKFNVLNLSKRSLE